MSDLPVIHKMTYEWSKELTKSLACHSSKERHTRDPKSFLKSARIIDYQLSFECHDKHTEIKQSLINLKCNTLHVKIYSKL